MKNRLIISADGFFMNQNIGKVLNKSCRYDQSILNFFDND